MSIPRHHSEWLSLVEVSGPFVSMPVLLRVFPQGLEAHNPDRFRLLRMAYEEWEDNTQAGPRTNPAIHANWIRFILRTMLELPESAIAEGQAIAQTLQAPIAEHGEILRPNFVIKTADGGLDGGKPRLLIQTYPASQDLSKPVHGCSWKASPDTRMMELLHATGVRLGLVTNGEQWMLVDAPRNETTGFASWYAHLWLEEQITLRAFTSLLNANRFFAVPDPDTLEKMLEESAANQQEVTTQLGYQVRKAVEVLVQSIDRADQDHGRQLLADIPETELYEAALTVMMRLVFLFCAEERGLLLLGDAVYDENYAVSTIQKQLHETADQHGEEILERRHDAWCRLLSTFRGVFGGITHERMTLPAYGGKLFNPDRFPFLEGRKKGTSWKTCDAEPLPINNRTVLHLLDALQLLQVKLPGGGPAEARRLSFRALDIEQIGHVYEGLLDHTAKRATEPVLGLKGAKDKEPELTLSELEQVAAKGEDALVALLVEETGRSEKTLRKALQVFPSPGTPGEGRGEGLGRFEAVCGTSADSGKMLDRIMPFAGLIRDDTFGYPVIIPTGSVYVTAGTDRRSSGTHYTPRSLTEPIVQYTLEPLVYVGPAEGLPKEQWKLRPAGELLAMKIGDMACGSGAFLVQACRHMSERLLEAWELAENALPKGTPGITPEGTASTGKPGETLIPKNDDERKTYALRLIAQRCLYGVDKNPLAVEMAKLSLWLLTLAKGKPFEFLDHAIRCGDSLVGIHNTEQLRKFNLDGKGEDNAVFLQFLDQRIKEVIALRRQITEMQANTVEDVEAQDRILREANERIDRLKRAADMLISAEFVSGSAADKRAARDHAAIKVAVHFNDSDLPTFRREAQKALAGQVTFHWPLEFPEVIVERGGFDAFVGNPPFMGGSKIATELGVQYRDYLTETLAHGVRGQRGQADLCSFFFLRLVLLVRQHGGFGVLATNTIAQGDTRIVGLDQLARSGVTIYRAISSRKWPGTASLEVAVVWMRRGSWSALHYLDDDTTGEITPYLTSSSGVAPTPAILLANKNLSFEGSRVEGKGFVLEPSRAAELLDKNPRNRDVLYEYLRGDDFTSVPDQSPAYWVINFHSWPLNRASAPEGYAGPVATDYPDCLEIVERDVKPQRLALPPTIPINITTAANWWRYRDVCPALHAALKETDVKRVLFHAFTSKYIAFAFVKCGCVFAAPHNVFVLDGWEDFALLQSTCHIVWAEAHCSTLETRIRYTRSSCFETFCFPGERASLSNIGSEYHEYRRRTMLDRQEGLTKTYNRFHDPDEAAKDIQKLRDVHVEMDKAVGAAYGWDDLKLGHDFHQTKQGLRFTISESARREVLARLLKLNHARYAEEVAQGLHEKGKGKGKPKPKPATRPQDDEPSLFGPPLAPDKSDNDDIPADVEAEEQAEPAESGDTDCPQRPVAIDDVDTDQAMAAFRQACRGTGWMEREEALKAVSERLGYQRLGSKIRDRLKGHLRAALRRLVLEADGDMVRIATPTMNSYWEQYRDQFIDLLVGTMRTGQRCERDEVIYALASRLGFERVRETVEEPIRSAMNGAIRRGLIAADGNVIWRV